MEPALPPLHPLIPSLMAHLGLRIVDAIKWNVIACTDETGPRSRPKWIVKVGSDARKHDSLTYETRILREVLPMFDQSQFERLVLPEYVDDGVFEDLRWVRIKYIHGQQLVYEWSELTAKPDILGGRGMDLKVAEMAIDVLRDLRTVDIEGLPSFVRRFDAGAWVDDFRNRSALLVNRGVMEQATVDQALELFSSKRALRYEGSMFTNGDFYPRNFVLLPKGKVAVTDWVGGVDPWEFVAMRTWLLMWGNPKWQIEYLKSLRHHFPIDVEEMRTGLLIGSFEQAYRWREPSEETVGFARTQMLAYFRECLDLEYVKSLFSQAV